MRILHFAWALLALSSAALAQPAKPPSTTKLASDYISRELGARMNVPPGAQLQLDKASKNSYSPEQMAAVRAVFGSENPLQVKRLPASAGKRSYSITLPARQYQDDSETLAWEQGNMLASSAPNGTIAFTGSMQSIKVAGESGRVEMTGVNFNTSQQRNYWGGKVRAEIGRISHTPQGKDASVSLEGFRYGSEIKLKGKYYEGQTDMMIGRFLVAGHGVDNLHIGTSLRKFDAATLAELRKEMLAMQADSSTAADPKQVLARFIPYIKRLAMRGAVVDVSDFSASYKGHKVAMTASLSMPDASDADFESGNAIMKKLSGKVDIAVPLSLLREIARNFADNHNRGKEKPDVPSARLAEQIYESMLGKAIANKYARIDKDMLRATIELQKGVLLVNGQTMPLEPLLAALNKDDGKTPPPADTSVPVPLSMRERGLEVAQVFALNGDQQGLFDLCERHMDGIGVPADIEEGMKWCDKAVASGSDEAVKLLARRQLDGRFKGDFAPVLDKLKKQADVALSPEAQFLMSRLTDDRAQAAAYLRQAAQGGNQEAMAQLPGVKGIARTSRTPWQLAMDEQGGYYDKETYRFDAAKRRHLRLSLLEARKHEKWMPVANVCLGAMLPSDAACIRLQGNQEQGSVIVYSDLITQGDSKSGKVKVLESPFKLGEPIDLVVYTDKNRAYFVVNGGETLVQEIGYPVETLSLACSGAKCDFQFQRAPE